MPTPEQKATAECFYTRGNEYRRQSDWKHALECYNEAIELDPESPAAVAKLMLEHIQNYYCKEMFNP